MMNRTPLEDFRERVLELALDYGFAIEDSASWVIDDHDPAPYYRALWRLELPFSYLTMPAGHRDEESAPEDTQMCGGGVR